MIYIQLIGILAFCLLVLSYYKKNVNSILMYQATSNFVYSVHYFLLGALSGAFISIIGIARSILFLKPEENKLLKSIVILILYIIVTCAFFENIYSLLPLIGGSLYLISMNFNSRKALLIGGILNSICWNIYSIFVGSYAGVVTELIVTSSNIIQLIRLKKLNKTS